MQFKFQNEILNLHLGVIDHEYFRSKKKKWNAWFNTLYFSRIRIRFRFAVCFGTNIINHWIRLSRYGWVSDFTELCFETSPNLLLKSISEHFSASPLHGSEYLDVHDLTLNVFLVFSPWFLRSLAAFLHIEYWRTLNLSDTESSHLSEP